MVGDDCGVEAVGQQKQGAAEGKFEVADHEFNVFFGGPNGVCPKMDAVGFVDAKDFVAFVVDPRFDVGVFVSVQFKRDFDVFNRFSPNQHVMGSASPLKNLKRNPLKKSQNLFSPKHRPDFDAPDCAHVPAYVFFCFSKPVL